MQVLDKLRQRRLPRLLSMVVDLAEFLRVQPELAGHPHVRRRQPVPALRVGPRLLPSRDRLLRHVRPAWCPPPRRVRSGPAGMPRPLLFGQATAEVAAGQASSPWMWPSYQPCTAACKIADSGVASPEFMALIAFSTISLSTADSRSGNGGDGIGPCGPVMAGNPTPAIRSGLRGAGWPILPPRRYTSAAGRSRQGKALLRDLVRGGR